MKRVILKILFVMLLIASVSFAATNYSAYVMGYFKESPDASVNSSNIHLAISNDGLNWVPLNQNEYVLKPEMGTKSIRDPFFFRMPDGSFTIVGTDNWNSEYIHVWSSPDLCTFTNERLIRMNTSGMHAWAPEVFYDASKKQYAIMWSGNNGRNRIYVSYTTDFTKVTTSEVFFDPGFGVIDGHMEVGVNGQNYLYYKHEKDYKIYGTRSASLTAGSFNTATYTSGWGPGIGGSHIEAPILIKSNTSNTWWLWGDSYKPVNAVFYCWQNTDLSTNTWSAVSRRDYTAPINSKHATIIPITASEKAALIAKWRLPTWDIVKSYRIPGAFIRQASGKAKIASFPFDPINDMKWKIVPGLSDAKGVSFQSFANAKNYLVTSGYVANVGANDNSETFKTNATFYRVAGFTNASWTSFKSCANPDRYLRVMADSSLRIDQIATSSSSTDKEDATFKLCNESVNTDPVDIVKTENTNKSTMHGKNAFTVTVTSAGILCTKNAEQMYSPITARLFTMQGKLISTLYNREIARKTIVVPFEKGNTPCGAFLVKITSDNGIINSTQAVMVSGKK